MRSQLGPFFNLINARSRFEIESYRQRGEAMARQGLVPATAFIPVVEHRLPVGDLPWSERHTGLPQERHGTPAIPFNPKAFEADHSC
jgi:hypothetical protein